MSKNSLQNNSKMTSSAVTIFRPFTAFSRKRFIKHLVLKVKKTLEEVDLTEDELSQPFYEAQ